MQKIESTPLAMLAQKCPRCHTGPLFNHSVWNLSKLTDMPEACPVCGQRYEPEPGFYWGAMYISFGFSTGIMLVVGFLVYHLLHDPDVWVYILSVAVVTVLFAPLSLRYSRTIMLYLFGGANYDPNYTASATRTTRPL
ncbi:hypothetical protein PK28_13485 [Hymenobacter sp. DG25B]|jgi:uncharacterized protein (DUF983 family)|uniref:DUF983 domain-containing protein n=1 Tax=Hymenobacter sp. DG25B TaxID=1385664 RepID=UPI00054127AF|nr:DUF983 domain-containing protein [Hymenobacter sp. DG25B]AIZ64432.1 hypothetical protein PK28_13485 [Hymenobacter sp. DG25B]